MAVGCERLKVFLRGTEVWNVVRTLLLVTEREQRGGEIRVIYPVGTRWNSNDRPRGRGVLQTLARLQRIIPTLRDVVECCAACRIVCRPQREQSSTRPPFPSSAFSSQPT